jgi:hypothetical protein
MSDISSLIKKSNYSLQEFKQEIKGKAFTNLYLSSLVDSSPSESIESLENFSNSEPYNVDEDANNIDSVMA